MKSASKILILTNLIPPYWLPILEHFEKKVGELQIFLSTHMEPNRHWKPRWGNLSVYVQKSLTFVKSWRHEQGFCENVFVHLPYDTLPILWRERPDVVISAQLGFRTMQAALYRKLSPQTRLIVWTAISEQTEKGLSLIRTLQRRFLLRFSDAVLADGESGIRYLMRLGVPASKIFPLYYHIELSEFLSLPLERPTATAKRLIYFGQIVKRKGLKPFMIVLAKWLALHPGQKVEFWIVGDGPLRKELEAFSLPPTLTLRFLGNVEYNELPKLYAQGGILVFPTLADEWGVVVNEALASGMPVLGSSYSQAVEELVKDGVSGWTFQPDDEEKMYEALDRALSTSFGRLNEMRLKCREGLHNVSLESGVNYLLGAIEYVLSPTKNRSDRIEKQFCSDNNAPERTEVSTR